MANIAGIQDDNIRTYDINDVQLFTRSGGYVTTVKLPYSRPEIVIWGDRFFRLDGGRYVESLAFTSIEAPR